ncbi:uncharacterized protein G2W53_037098 [Senna tora]|uniref:Uncharacterized protein n=1 Tax=Senna tora TaxID=362788 RepID=A0A834SU37_9FABA|nr:uncharacterized protein G2W53_037098 [Senna tora]
MSSSDVWVRMTEGARRARSVGELHQLVSSVGKLARSIGEAYLFHSIVLLPTSFNFMSIVRCAVKALFGQPMEVESLLEAGGQDYSSKGAIWPTDYLDVPLLIK